MDEQKVRQTDARLLPRLRDGHSLSSLSLLGLLTSSAMFAREVKYVLQNAQTNQTMVLNIITDLTDR